MPLKPRQKWPFCCSSLSLGEKNKQTNKHTNTQIPVNKSLPAFFRQALPSQAYFSGKVKGEEAIKTESEMGSAITHHFRVSAGKAARATGSQSHWHWYGMNSGSATLVSSQSVDHKSGKEPDGNRHPGDPLAKGDGG